jgi:phage/plasmid-associated DNA primase
MEDDKIKTILKKQELVSDFGFYIFRIREANEGNDFIFYNIKNKKYNIWSKRKVCDLIKAELGLDKFNFFKVSLTKINEDKEFFNVFLSDYVILVDNISFLPKEELLFFENNKLFFNIYKKSEFMLLNDLKLDKNKDYSKDYPLIEKLLMHICVNDINLYDYVKKWYAWKIQNPEVKLPTALIFQSEKGTGKTFFQERVIKKIFEHLWKSVNVDNFDEKYNNFMFGSLLVHLEEAINNEQQEKTSQKLKSYISDNIIPIRRMNTDPYEVRCYASITENTNTHKPVFIEENDRRYIIVGYQNRKIDEELITELLLNIDEEVKAFYFHLKTLKLNLSELLVPYHTEAKTNIRKYNMSSLENFFDEFDFSQFKSEDLIKNKYYETHIFYKRYVTFCLECGYKNPFSRNKFTMELKIRGYNDKLIRLGQDVVRCIEVIKDVPEQ